MRVDFNVPFDRDGSISDDTRIRSSLPSITYILNHGGSIILMSHLGRPKGKDSKLSLAPCGKRLSELLSLPVLMAPDCVGSTAQQMALSLKQGQLLLLENLRFYPAEENPDLDPDFAKNLSALADLYVDDAFGAAHRSHSSITAVPSYFRGRAAAGLLMEKEISSLEKLVTVPARPFFTIIGGAKISSKIGLLTSLVDKVDGLFIGGAMAHVFLKIQGMDIGSSLCETEHEKTAQDLMAQCKKKKIPLWLPSDLVIADRVDGTGDRQIVQTDQKIPLGWQGVDIGPATVKMWERELKSAATVFWNGPLGIFECAPFAQGTQEIARFLSELPAVTIVGGGDSISAISQMNIQEKFSHLSTGGGATLEYLEYGHLPGVDALTIV